jgi:hypothetical protein
LYSAPDFAAHEAATKEKSIARKKRVRSRGFITPPVEKSARSVREARADNVCEL